MHPPRRHLSRPINRAFAAAFVQAIDRLAPDHPDYAYWQARRQEFAILAEVGW
jgi:hypothetical protein